MSYPYIAADVQLTDADGALVCAQHPVNGGAGVSTQYSGVEGLPASIVWEMAIAPGGGVSVAPYPPAPR